MEQILINYTKIDNNITLCINGLGKMKFYNQDSEEVQSIVNILKKIIDDI